MVYAYAAIQEGVPYANGAPSLAADIPALVGNMFWGGYDLQTGAYYLNMASNELPSQYKPVPPLARSFFSPEELANEGAR